MTESRVSPFIVLQARAEARALLYCTGEYESVEEAIAPLYNYAQERGLVDQVGSAAMRRGPRCVFHWPLSCCAIPSNAEVFDN